MLFGEVTSRPAPLVSEVGPDTPDKEVDAFLARAQGAGGRVLRPAEDGYTGYFADPDGHPWEVAWNPHFTLRDDGALQLPT